MRREIEKGQISHGSQLKRALFKRAQGRGLGVHWRHLKKEGEDGDKENKKKSTKDAHIMPKHIKDAVLNPRLFN